MKNFIAVIAVYLALFSCSQEGFAQGRISNPDLKKLRMLDDSLRQFGNKMLDAELSTDRLRADSLFTRVLVRALVVPFSYQFRFDSMDMAPIVYPQDSSFRIITWHVPYELGNFRQKGVIQMNTKNGSPKLFPLFDVSDYDTTLQFGIRKPNNWVGAVYYRILQNEDNARKVYTLLGYDENSSLTTRKWIDFLQFDESGEPIFGGNFMKFSHDSIYNQRASRYLYEYKKLGNARLNFDDDENVIVLDHLISETGEKDKRFTLIPGGDYETFKWQNGYWVHNNKWFMENRGDDNAPLQMTILDDKGNVNQAAIDRQNALNLEKEILNQAESLPAPVKADPAKSPGKIKKKKKDRKD